MTAGQPNWQRLHELGKLPAHGRKFVPGLITLDALRGKLCEKCQEVFDEHVKEPADQPKKTEKTEWKCDQCDFTSKAQIALISHKRTHGDQNDKANEAKE